MEFVADLLTGERLRRGTRHKRRALRCWDQAVMVCRWFFDGTLIRTDRLTTPGPTPGVGLWWSGKHKHHGGNVQVVTAPDGFPLWVSSVRPGREHDTSAARAHPGLLDALATWASNGRKVLADLGYLGEAAHRFRERVAAADRRLRPLLTPDAFPRIPVTGWWARGMVRFARRRLVDDMKERMHIDLFEVKATARGVVLDLDHRGRVPILEAISLELLDRGDASLTTVRLGVGAAGARRVLEKLNGPAIDFSLQEVHVMVAALCSALALPSEQDFHERIGAFKGEALELVGALLRGASADPDRPHDRQIDGHGHPSETSESQDACGDE